jgi:hypothetical protein
MNRVSLQCSCKGGVLKGRALGSMNAGSYRTGQPERTWSVVWVVCEALVEALIWWLREKQARSAMRLSRHTRASVSLGTEC